MATRTHLQWLDKMVGGGIHNLPDFTSTGIAVSLLDQTDSGDIVNTFIDYDEIDTNVVFSTNLAFASSTAGVTTLSAPTTMGSVSGDAADFLTAWADSGTPATSTLIITWDSATSGLPVTPNSGDIILTWGSNIFATLA